MSPVRVLPDALIDQIAAGEVIERPASVVKELVENSLDAGAQRVRVDIRDGGAQLVAVTDDGCGMPQQDARLALQRHATSKLATQDDLQQIGSFGFRGEALPAIASVSRMRLVTRERDSAEGWEIRIDSGRIIDQRAAGGPAGTRIEVADLFKAIPARRKFLKKASTEWGHILDWLGRLALALPGVHFEVQRDDRAATVWPAASDPLDRIAAVLGERVAAGLVPAVFEGPEGHIEAYLSGPEHARANGNGIYLFVNGRPVRDPVLRHAVLDAYRDLLPRGRYPSALAFLTVAPDRVDVNVHPAKWEVRFAEPRAVHQLVRHCVRDAMAERRWLDGAGPGTLEPPSTGPTALSGTALSGTSGPYRSHRATDGTVGLREQPTASAWALARQPGLSEAGSAMTEGRPPEVRPASANPDAIQFRGLRVLGQLLASYLLVEGKAGLIVVDQHAAHERVLYERLRGQWLDEGVSIQPLLIPEPVDLDPLSVSSLADASSLVARLGFEIELFGDASVVVRAIPALLSGRSPANLVRSLAEELDGSERGSPADGDPETPEADATRLLPAADRVFASLACHSARRFGDHLEPEEQRAILAGLDDIPWAPTCPHGRPVAVSLDQVEIERRFGRR